MFMLQQQSGTFSILYENCGKKKKKKRRRSINMYTCMFMHVFPVYLLFSKMEISNSETTRQISDRLCTQI